MRRASRFLTGLCLTGLVVACAGVRTTGPKTALDRCVDQCDMTVEWCDSPTFAAGCQVEYDSCLAQCDVKTPAM